LARLEKQYNKLNNNLDYNKEGSICTSWSVFSKANSKNRHPHPYGRADAILFGHIARGLGHPMLCDIIKKYPSLVAYFNSICKQYFGATSHRDCKHAWEVSLQTLLQNPFLNEISYLEVKDTIARELVVGGAVGLLTCLTLKKQLHAGTVLDEPSEPVLDIKVLPDTITGKLSSGIFLAMIGMSFVGYLVLVNRK
jgi:hypothetical protein